MTFIEPMHRNKPNITYLLTYLQPDWCIGPVYDQHNETAAGMDSLFF